MAKTHGSKAKFWITTAGGALTDISSYVNTAALNRTADTAEVSVLGSTDKDFVPGLKGATIPVGGFIDNTVDVILDAILGMARNWKYQPQGTGTGLPEYTGSAILTSYDLTTATGAAGGSAGEFTVTGAVTRATQP